MRYEGYKLHPPQRETAEIQATVFIRLNAAAFIKFLAFPIQGRQASLFEGGVYFEITFLKSLTTAICKSFVNTRNLKACQDVLNYQVVPRFFLLYPSRRRILLIRCDVYSRAAFIGNFAPIGGV